jgi:hypothetical protein
MFARNCVGGRMMPGRTVKAVRNITVGIRLAIAKTWIVVHPTRPLPIYPLPPCPAVDESISIGASLGGFDLTFGDCDSDPLDAGQQQSEGQVSDRGGRKAGLGPEHSSPTLAAGVLRGS